MPYGTRSKGKGKVQVVNKATGRVLAKGTTKAKAKSQIRLLQAIKHNPDFKPRNRKPKR